VELGQNILDNILIESEKNYPRTPFTASQIRNVFLLCSHPQYYTFIVTVLNAVFERFWRWFQVQEYRSEFN